MTSPIRTSLVIAFGSNLDSDILQVEVDPRPDGLNAGRSNFYPGDTVYLLEYKTPEVSILDRYATDGGLVALGSGSMTTTEFVTVSGGATVSASKPISGSLVVLRSWGRPATVRSYSGVTVNLAEPTVAVLEIRYVTNYQVLRLSGSSGVAPVLVYLMGTVEE